MIEFNELEDKYGIDWSSEWDGYDVYYVFYEDGIAIAKYREVRDGYDVLYVE